MMSSIKITNSSRSELFTGIFKTEDGPNKTILLLEYQLYVTGLHTLHLHYIIAALQVLPHVNLQITVLGTTTFSYSHYRVHILTDNKRLSLLVPTPLLWAVG
jgi:hypothetical protein